MQFMSVKNIEDLNCEVMSAYFFGIIILGVVKGSALALYVRKTMVHFDLLRQKRTVIPYQPPSLR